MKRMNVLKKGLCACLAAVTLLGLTACGGSGQESADASEDTAVEETEAPVSADTGVTMLDIETGYGGTRQQAVMCIVHAKKHPAVCNTALAIDPGAFIITTEVKNVHGQGYTIARRIPEQFQ